MTRPEPDPAVTSAPVPQLDLGLHEIDPPLSDENLTQHHTDLPLSLRGNSGRGGPSNGREVTAADLLDALDDTLTQPCGPPLHELDPRAVEQWLEMAARGLVFRRDQLALIRKVQRVLHEEWRSAWSIELMREQVEAREADRQARIDGTYWARRDGGRRARQATHVEVDHEAWASAKAAAQREGVGIGVFVGQLIVRELRKPEERSIVAARRGSDEERNGDRARIFARVAADKATWTEFVARSKRAGVTVARHLGLIVERKAR